ncbi:MAG: S8 family serine peptidase [Phycisphaerales bacterium]|nr:S8 family serine peptidase [Phycisphaerales bacterium]
MSHRRSVVALVTAIAGLACSAGAQVQWRSSPDGVLDIEMPAAVHQQMVALASRPTDKRVVIEFGRALSQAERTSLAAIGVRTLTALGGGAYFASLDSAQLDAARVLATAQVRRVRAIDSTWKLHEMLAVGERTPWAEVGGTPENPVIGAYVRLHDDAPLDASSEQIVTALGGIIRDVLVSANGYVIEIPRDRILALASNDAVQWIEPALPRMSEVALLRNNENRALTGADTAQSVYGLDGTGVKALIYDGGTALSTHTFYGGRLTTLDSSGVIAHATHVAATVGGSGVIGTGNHRGMAPNATLFSAGFQSDGTGTFLYTNPGDIESDYGNAINNRGVVLTNNSIGTNTETNGFPCSIQGDYGMTDVVIDSIARGSIGNAPIIVWAAGNERQGTRCNVEGFGSYYSSAPPAGAKNHLCIGAVNANDDSMTSFSSWGPTDDGRMKPDFSAPGCQSNGDGGVTSASNSSTTATTTMCGTSMASPTACGIVALMLQDHRTQFPGRLDPLSSTVKAILAHTAVDRGIIGPDYQFGYGSIRAVAAIDQMRLDAHSEVAVEQGEIRNFIFDVAPGQTSIKVTAAWADVPAAANATNALINDIDIRLISPSGVTFYPWTLNPASPSSAAVRTAANHRDNIEQVLVDNPQSGQWRCEVVGFSVPSGPQTVSIVGPAGMVERGVRVQVATVPSLVDPGTVLTANVNVIVVEDTLVPNSVQLHARNDGGAFNTTQLTFLGGNSYSAQLPAVLCADPMEFYVTAQGVLSGLVSSPTAGPNAPYAVEAGIYTTGFADNFQTDTGWTVTNDANLTDGPWTRGVPVGGGTRGDPATDFDGSGACYLTDNVAGNSDVDGGTTTLTSPTFDGSQGDSYINYARWFHNAAGDNPGTETFVIEVSNNDGASWVNLETIGPAGTGTTGGWFYVSHRIADVITPTNTMRVRYKASDLGLQGVIEAAVDAFSITTFSCVDPEPDCPADFNNDNTLDFFDVQAFLAAFSAQQPAADFNHDSAFNFFDVQAFLQAFANGCP